MIFEFGRMIMDIVRSIMFLRISLFCRYVSAERGFTCCRYGENVRFEYWQCPECRYWKCPKLEK